MALRKKYEKITSFSVVLRILTVWGWFWICNYGAGGDAYFAAVVQCCVRRAAGGGGEVPGASGRVSIPRTPCSLSRG